MRYSDFDEFGIFSVDGRLLTGENSYLKLDTIEFARTIKILNTAKNIEKIKSHVKEKYPTAEEYKISVYLFNNTIEYIQFYVKEFDTITQLIQINKNGK